MFCSVFLLLGEGIWNVLGHSLSYLLLLGPVELKLMFTPFSSEFKHPIYPQNYYNTKLFNVHKAILPFRFD